MNLKNSLFLHAFLLIISCSTNKTDFDYKEVPSAKPLKGLAITVNPSITMPSKIYSVDDKLIIYDKIKNNIFKVFELPNIKHLYSWGQIGKGPHEFSFITENSMYIYKNNLEFLDFNKLNVFQLKKDTFILQNQITIQNLIPINNLRRLCDSICIADNPMTEKDNFEHVIYNLNNNKINKFGKYINDYRFNNNSERYQAFFKNCVTNSRGGQFAAFYSGTNLIRIYDTDNNIEKKIIPNLGDIRNKLIKFNKEAAIYYVEPVAVDKYIYVLMINKTKKAIEANFKNFKPKLQIWDWNGNPIIEYSLDQPITSFCVSKKHKKIYGISFFNIDKIYEFNLPDSLFVVDEKSLTFKKIEHQGFSANMFESWVISQQMEEYSSYERNGYSYERHVYHNPKNVDVCGSSISITSITNKKNKKIKIDEYYKKNGHINIEGMQNYELIKTVVNNQETYHYRFDLASTDPKGMKSNNHFAVWLIDKENSLIEVKLSSCNEFQKYYGNLEKIVSSIKTID